MRLIDADALLENVKHAVYTDDLSTTIAVGICEAHIRAMPNVDAAPVKHGRWVQEEDRVNHWHCSNCIVVWGVTHRAFKYCPNCGAKMDLDG